ncbi:MAG: hypothetical protein ABMB14_39275, partial [Myxococcota bacterium]
MPRQWWILAAALAIGGGAIGGGCGSESALVNDVPAYPDSHPKDLASPEWTDRIVQVTVPKVDVLWTIDNSSSMGNEQRTLIENFPAFADYFVGSGLDYHIGVISTDVVNPSHDGSLQGAGGYLYIDGETVDPIDVFSAMATLGTNALGEECGLGAAFHALE